MARTPPATTCRTSSSARRSSRAAVMAMSRTPSDPSRPRSIRRRSRPSGTRSYATPSMRTSRTIQAQWRSRATASSTSSRATAFRGSSGRRARHRHIGAPDDGVHAQQLPHPAGDLRRFPHGRLSQHVLQRPQRAAGWHDRREVAVLPAYRIGNATKIDRRDLASSLETRRVG
jgi:hypothetical protein